jgi:hypothetical protein
VHKYRSMSKGVAAQMSIPPPNDIHRQVNAKLAEFRFSDALNDMVTISEVSDPKLIALKIKLMSLVGDVDSAMTLYNKANDTPHEKITCEMAKGLLGNLSLYEGFTLLINSLQRKPDSPEVLSLLFSFFTTFNAFDDLLALLEKEYIELQRIPVNFLLRLAVRLQINHREQDSSRVLALFLSRLKESLPMQVPWLLLSHGEKQRANALLAELSADSRLSHSIFQTHHFYLKAEFPELFNQLNQKVNLTWGALKLPRSL